VTFVTFRLTPGAREVRCKVLRAATQQPAITITQLGKRLSELILLESIYIALHQPGVNYTDDNVLLQPCVAIRVL
jgi:hypothetical protein